MEAPAIASPAKALYNMFILIYIPRSRSHHEKSRIRIKKGAIFARWLVALFSYSLADLLVCLLTYSLTYTHINDSLDQTPGLCIWDGVARGVVDGCLDLVGGAR